MTHDWTTVVVVVVVERHMRLVRKRPIHKSRHHTDAVLRLMEPKFHSARNTSHPAFSCNLLVTTGILIELGIGAGAQILARVHVFEPHRFVSHPEFRPARGAFHRPIAPAVSNAVSVAVPRHLLLSTERTFRQVRMQIAQGVLVRQANRGAARNGLGELARGILGILGFLGIVVCGADPPQCVRVGVVLHKRDNLLARSTAQLLFFTVQIVFAVLVLEFNERSARDKVLIIVY